METPKPLLESTGAYFTQTAIAFGVSFGSLAIGIACLPISVWQRSFLAICGLFLVTSCFNLAKVIRDQQEAATVRVRLDEARMEKLIAEHNPFNSAA